MQGKIIKGIAGFYYVYAEDGNTYECRAKGIFRKDKFKPLVGDNVDITVLDEKELEGSVTEIDPTAAVFTFLSKSEKYAAVPKVQRSPVTKRKNMIFLKIFSFIYILRLIKLLHITWSRRHPVLCSGSHISDMLLLPAQ